jgi:MFS transporter, DHA1 family, inner membrane transport protein
MIAAALLNAYDWKMPFVVCGAFGIVLMVMIAVLISPWFSESKRNEEQASGAHRTDQGSNGSTWSTSTILLGFASICTGVAVFGFFGLYPLFLRTVIGLTPAQAGLIMSAIGFGGFLSPLGGWLGDRVGYHKILFVALPLTAVSAGIPFTGLLGQSVAAYAALAFIYGFAVVGLIYANLSAIIIDSMGPSKTALASGLFIGSYYIPAAFAGYTMGWLKEASSWTTAGILQGSGFAAIALVLIVVARMKRAPAMLLPSGATS